MTQKEKMLSGQPYNAADLQLVFERLRCSIILSKYNKKVSYEWCMKNRLLKKILNTKGKFYIRPPFYCDYGKNIYVGKNFFCNFGCTILDVAPVIIGDNAWFGPNVQIYTASHAINSRERNKGIEFGKKIYIGNNVWIGGNVIVLPGIKIGDNCVIGAGSVVTKSIPNNSLAVGNPAKIIRQIK